MAVIRNGDFHSLKTSTDDNLCLHDKLRWVFLFVRLNHPHVVKQREYF